MIRTNSFSIKISISLTLLSFSLFFFYISYQEFSKYYQDDLVLFEDMNINYFDKELFQKYYEKIDIEKTLIRYLLLKKSFANKVIARNINIVKLYDLAYVE